jgi:PKD repeat protein
MRRLKPVLLSISTPAVFVLLFFNLLPASVGPYTQIMCSIMNTTQYTTMNPDPTVAGTTAHFFYDEAGSVLGFTTIPLPPLGSEMLTVGDYVPAGYQGYAIISADIPVSITVDGGPGALLTASFDANPTSGSAPHTVTFTNTSSGYDMSLWELGDGVTSTLDSLSYTYTMPGTYTVKLTVSKSGCLVTTPQFNPTHSAFITVSEGDSRLYLPVVLGE